MNACIMSFWGLAPGTNLLSINDFANLEANKFGSRRQAADITHPMSLPKPTRSPSLGKIMLNGQR